MIETVLLVLLAVVLLAAAFVLVRRLPAGDREIITRGGKTPAGAPVPPPRSQAEPPAPPPRISESDRLVASKIRETFVITMTGGEAFRGLLIDVDATTLLLTQAQALAADGSAIPVDGDIYLARGDVAYMQRP